MATDNMKKTTQIHAPEDKVFSYVTDPAHLPEWMPNLVEVNNISGPQSVGTTWGYHYAFAGTHHKGLARTTAFEINKHVAVKTEGDFASEWHYRFEPNGDYTRLTVEVDYEMPKSLLAKIEAPILQKLNENVAEHALLNLKAHLDK